MIPIPAGKWLLRTEWIVLRDANVSYLEDPSKGAEVNITAIGVGCREHVLMSEGGLVLSYLRPD